MRNPVHRIKQFYEETVQEVKKCSWPSRPELRESTTLVLLSVAILTAFVWLVDMAAQPAVRYIINLGK